MTSDHRRCMWAGTTDRSSAPADPGGMTSRENRRPPCDRRRERPDSSRSSAHVLDVKPGLIARVEPFDQFLEHVLRVMTTSLSSPAMRRSTLAGGLRPPGRPSSKAARISEVMVRLPIRPALWPARPLPGPAPCAGRCDV